MSAESETARNSGALYNGQKSAVATRHDDTQLSYTGVPALRCAFIEMYVCASHHQSITSAVYANMDYDFSGAPFQVAQSLRNLW